VPVILLVCTLFAAGPVGDASPLILGADDEADVLLLAPRQAEEGPDGNLYVLDVGDSTIKVYTPAGEFLRSLAGKGEGPGEFQRIDGASFGFTPAGLLFFAEYIRGHRWLTIMELDGRVVRTLSPVVDMTFGVAKAAALDDGGFLLQLAYMSTVHRQQEYFLYDSPRSLVRINAEGHVTAELKRTMVTTGISYSADGGDTSLPFRPAFAWTLLAGGEVVWTDGTSPVFTLFALDGRPARALQSPLPEPTPVTSDELADWQRERKTRGLENYPDWWHRFGRVVEEYDESLYPRPSAQRLSTTPGGRILVEGVWNGETGGAHYWLLDAEGQQLCARVLAIRDLHVSPHFVMGFVDDDEGRTLLYVMNHGGDEMAALSKVGTMLETEETP